MNLSDAQSYTIHRELVLMAIRDVFHVDTIDGRPIANVVGDYYDGMPQRAWLLVVNDDPLGLAAEFVVKELKFSEKQDYRGEFHRFKLRILNEYLMGH